jgi:hypothetical protein
MTIKGENTSNNRRGGGGNGMQYVVSSEPTSAEHIEDDIPFATAVPVEVATSIPTDQQQFQPQFVTTTPSNELMATPATTTTTSSNSNNSRQLNQTAATTAERPPPTGLPPGGRWVKMRHVGSNSKFFLNDDVWCGRSRIGSVVSLTQFFTMLILVVKLL